MSNEHPSHSWNEHIKSILIAVVLALVFRSFAFEPFHIPSSSMKDGLLIGDYLFVSKYQYGYSRYSFPLGLPLLSGRTSDNRPKRGEVVVFRQPLNPRIDFIKRVIGLPGDTVQVKGGVVFLNGRPLPRTRVDDFIEFHGDVMRATRKYRETLPSGISYEVLDAQQGGAWDDTLIYRVPSRHYFMMGDNRDNSSDSRDPNVVGFVPEENIVGRAELIFFSVDEGTPLWQFWRWAWAMRTERFLKVIH